MSAVANWSYTAKATHWALIARNGRSGASTFAAPVVFACDYDTEARTVRNARGLEFVTRMTYYTERSTVRQGDRVALGVSTETDPIRAGAEEVQHVQRHADTFDRAADDYVVHI
jgi:hypothetical protein